MERRSLWLSHSGCLCVGKHIATDCKGSVEERPGLLEVNYAPVFLKIWTGHFKYRKYRQKLSAISLGVCSHMSWAEEGIRISFSRWGCLLSFCVSGAQVRSDAQEWQPVINRNSRSLREPGGVWTTTSFQIKGWPGSFITGDTNRGLTGEVRPRRKGMSDGEVRPIS